MSGRQWSAIHSEADVQAQCMTWLFAYFDVSWVVHGGPRSQVPCLGRDAMEVRRGKGRMQASLNKSISQQDGIARAVAAAFDASGGQKILACCLMWLGHARLMLSFYRSVAHPSCASCF